MKFTDIFSRELFDKMVTEGFVRVQTHDVLPYRILNYSEKTQFQSMWNECTLNCRGLVIDADDNVIARPFSKFFNMSESHAAQLDWDAPVEVTDKKDGSMGVLYPIKILEGLYTPGNLFSFSTRGSFGSDQAIHATKLWLSKYKDLLVPNDYTFIFEIVYPENRIVLDYGGMDDLILLGAIDKHYGTVYGPVTAQALLEWPGPVTEVFNYANVHEAVAAPYRANAEGFVIRSGGNMVKLKQADYIELHKLISMLSERSVWSQLKDGKTIEEICEALPDEFHEFVKTVGMELNKKFFEIFKIVLGKYNSLIQLMPEGFDPEDRAQRGMFAREANKIDHYRSHMFCILDKKPVAELVWKQIRPEAKSEDGYPV